MTVPADAARRADAGVRSQGPSLVLGCLIAALCVGALLRLAWPGDIEYKGDEQWTFLHVQAFLAGGPWSWTGMGTSVRLAHPGMSLWTFILLGWLAGAKTPPVLGQAVHLFNLCAILGFVALARCAIPAGRREVWYWAAALWAVNPIAIILERKIWPPSILPPFFVLFLAAWLGRRRFVFAFGWGFMGALLGQVHTGAWFLTLGFLIWVLLDDPRAVHWGGWLAGTVIGGLPAIPWALDMLGPAGVWMHHWRSVPLLHFYLRWFLQPFGFGADYTLDWGGFHDYLTGPVIGGTATHLMAASFASQIGLAVVVALRSALKLVRGGLMPLRDVFLGSDEVTRAIAAALWGYGGLLSLFTLSGADSHRHYLIVVAPLMALWAASLVMWREPAALHRRARAILAALCLCQAIGSAGLLQYIHRVQVIHAEYGPTWQSQQSP